MKINISIDDVSPHPDSSTDVINVCSDLIDIFDDIKFTLFIPMAYTRLGEKTYCLRDYADFCTTINNLDSGRFELGWHGFLHGIIGRSNNDEFRYLTVDKANEKIKMMFDVANDIGIIKKIKPIFRPPAFWLSDESFAAIKKNNIKILALSPYINYNRKDIIFNDGNDRVIYFDSLPPIYPLVKKNVLSIVYHSSKWSKNRLDENRKKELISFLKSIDEPKKFVFMEDM